MFETIFKGNVELSFTFQRKYKAAGMFKIGHHQKLYFLSQYLNNTPAERSWGGENNSFYFKPSIVVVALPSADQGGRRRWLENKYKNGLDIEYIVDILIINIKRFEN